MATPLIAGAAVAATAMATRYAAVAWRNVMSRSAGRMRFPRGFQGGFEAEMNRKEALLILGVKEGTPRDEIRAAHRRLMRLNHPDNGGSTYVATKVNEAKDFLLSGRRGSRVI